VNATAAQDPAAFVRAKTTPAAPAMLPEMRLQLATDITPLWHTTEAELGELGIEPPYWAFAWPGGQALARTVLDMPELFRNRAVFVFAAGGGPEAVALAMAGARRVVANDIDPLAGAALALNAALNDVEIEVDIADRLGEPLDGYDTVLAGDVLYERPMADRTLTWLHDLARAGKRVFIGDPGRAYLDASDLVEFDRHPLPPSLTQENSGMTEAIVWTIAREAARP
jgi:predicted nicotinamide N-methyase